VGDAGVIAAHRTDGEVIGATDVRSIQSQGRWRVESAAAASGTVKHQGAHVPTLDSGASAAGGDQPRRRNTRRLRAAALANAQTGWTWRARATYSSLTASHDSGQNTLPLSDSKIGMSQADRRDDRVASAL